ncbi:hypothetical protein BZA77DRAFT_356713 [Pyronema omphalodes]|nr:hypothetical protein BZA77DRAFT_356713 [Pyronema omphalodes]
MTRKGFDRLRLVHRLLIAADATGAATAGPCHRSRPFGKFVSSLVKLKTRLARHQYYDCVSTLSSHRGDCSSHYHDSQERRQCTQLEPERTGSVNHFVNDRIRTPDPEGSGQQSKRLGKARDLKPHKPEPILAPRLTPNSSTTRRKCYATISG